MQSGERYSLLIDRETGMPLYSIENHFENAHVPLVHSAFSAVFVLSRSCSRDREQAIGCTGAAPAVAALQHAMCNLFYILS